MTEPRTWTLSNVRPLGGEPVDLLLEDGLIAAITPHAAEHASAHDDALPGSQPRPAPGGATAGGERASSGIGAEHAVVDGRGLLALPGLINAHAHVDKSWWGRGWVSYGGEGTTQGRIAHEREHRAGLGIPSESGARTILAEFLRHGTTATRSHVDVDLGVGLSGLEHVRAAAESLGGAVEVELVAFPQDGALRRPGVVKLLEEAAQLGVASIGGLDPAGIDRDPVGQLDALFDIVERTGVGLDLHLHDPRELGAFQIELIAERTVAAGAQGRVNVAHGFALGELAPGAQEELLGKVAEAGVSCSTVAPVRSAPLPWRRMRELGVGIGLGTDGIRDLWNPFGDGDLLKIALQFARVNGLHTDEDLAYAVELASTLAAPFVHRHAHGLEVGARADVVLVDALNVQDALVRTPARELVVAGGRVVAQRGELLV